jgi:choline dehydrogenase-like flavoprotein
VNTDMLAAIEAETTRRLDRQQVFDVIVVGGGGAGGMAAMLLTQAGLSVLVLDAGWRPRFLQAPLRHSVSGVVRMVADQRLLNILPPGIINQGRKALRLGGRIHRPVQTKCFAWELSPESFVDDRENPYIAEPGSPFNWYRAHQLGGRMIIPGHGRQYYRLGEQDLQPGDGLSPPWCVAAAEMSHWYDVVEQHLGIVGGNDHNRWVPDARVTTCLAPSAAEAETMAGIKGRWAAAQPILGRSAAPLDSLDIAARTSRLSCRRGAMVHDIEVDPSGQTRGVRWYDRGTRTMRSARADTVFLCASTLETTRILLSSRVGPTGPGIAAASGVLGRYLMDHVLLSAEGTTGALPGEPVSLEPGRCVYLPRFDLRNGVKAVGRGHAMLLYRWSTGLGKSYFRAVSLGEMTPRPENRVVLDATRRDAWGSPVLRISCRYDDTELRQAADQTEAMREVAETLGITLHSLDRQPAAPGAAIHEGGTARMGESPEQSVVDPHNQCWDARGLYVTDGASFPSQGVQNPTLSILALTARACDHVTRAGRTSS